MISLFDNQENGGTKWRRINLEIDVGNPRQSLVPSPQIIWGLDKENYSEYILIPLSCFQLWEATWFYLEGCMIFIFV